MFRVNKKIKITTHKNLSMRRRINRVNYIFIPLAILPVFLHAQFKLKNNTHRTWMKPLFKGQSLPAFSFLLPGIKRNVNRIDTIKQADKKMTLTNTISSENRADYRPFDLYNQAAKNNDSNYPEFHDYYFKMPGFTGVISDNSATLSWHTDINENVRFFLIERSTDRKDFNKIGEIDLAGKESVKNFYFTDCSISNSLLYYYQIKALLMDGSSITSYFIPVKNSMVELKTSLSRGSEKDILVLKTNQPTRKIEVINTDGQVVFRNKKASQEETINISEYLPGSYALKITGHNGFVTQLFFKKENSN
jgi:hypothetical protein